jgi:hypothetical protein
MTNAVTRIKRTHDNPALRGTFSDPINPGAAVHEDKLNIFIYETDGDDDVRKKANKNSRKPSEVQPHLRLIHAGQDFS